jgi:hypothetical protein
VCTSDAQLEHSLTTTTMAEIYIPARTLQYGIYQMKLTVTMYASLQLISSAATYIKIVPSPITVNLVPFGALMIVQKPQQMLTLDPGTFSVDPDVSYFNFSVSMTNQRKPMFIIVFRIGITHIFVESMAWIIFQLLMEQC